MTLQDFRIVFNKDLAEIYPKTEIDAFFFRLIEHKLGLQLMDVFTKPNLLLSSENLLDMNSVLRRLKNEEPIQYILGETEFYGLRFKVNKNVLIPRPETEELVSWVLDEARGDGLSIIDIGTGSGCIPISIKKSLPSAKVDAIDVSEKALSTAKKNAILNNVAVNFMQQDILQTEDLMKTYDIIVSNPPYVRELEKREIKNNVLQNEPHLALFVSDENPLVFYNKIADLAKKNLGENGLLFFEINQYLAKETEEMLLQKGFSSVVLKKDLFGNARMVLAKNII